jgi:hypothetical protein
MLCHVVKLYGEPHSMHRYNREIRTTQLRFCEPHNLNIQENFVSLPWTLTWERRLKQIFSIAPKLKARKQRVYYETNNYCATCRIKYPKGVLTCSDCKHKIRTTGWHSPKEADVKRI